MMVGRVLQFIGPREGVKTDMMCPAFGLCLA